MEKKRVTREKSFAGGSGETNVRGINYADRDFKTRDSMLLRFLSIALTFFGWSLPHLFSKLLLKQRLTSKDLRLWFTDKCERKYEQEVISSSFLKILYKEIYFEYSC